MKSRTVISAVAGAMVLLTGCNQDLKTSHSDVDDPSGQNGSETAASSQAGEIEGLYVGVSRDVLNEALGAPSAFRQEGPWQVADYNYVKGYNRYFRDSGPATFTSSGNIVADLLIVFVGAAIQTAASYRSDEVVESAVVVFDGQGKAQFLGREMPDAVDLQKALDGDRDAQFRLHKKADGPFKWGWLCKSANAGNAAAQVEIGRIYQSGYPTRFDHAQAWYAAASRNGHQQADLYGQEVSYFTSKLASYEDKGEKISAACDPRKPPTKTLAGETVTLNKSDCESVMRERLEEAHELLDRVAAGESEPLLRLGETYDRKVETVKECLPGGSIYASRDSAHSTDYDGAATAAQENGVEVEYVVALRMAAVRWNAVGTRFGKEVPGYVQTEIRDRLEKPDIEKAESQASDWVKRFGSGNKEGAGGKTSKATPGAADNDWTRPFLSTGRK